jgi:hypothetical protein
VSDQTVEYGSGFEYGRWARRWTGAGCGSGGRWAVDLNLGMGGGVRFWPVVSGWTWRWVSAWEVVACSGIGSGLGGDGRP